MTVRLGHEARKQLTFTMLFQHQFYSYSEFPVTCVSKSTLKYF